MDNALRLGCAALTTCNLLPLDTAAGLSGSSFCCTTDLCTNGSYIRDPGPAWRLPCQSCVGSASTCGPDTPTLTCPGRQAQCLQLSRRLLPGEQGDTVYKACRWRGPSEELLALATGPDLAYVHMQRCHSIGFNNGSFAEVPRGKPNGKLCYSCRERGAGECNRQELPTMSCTGAMDQCVKVQSTDENNPVTLLRGCASPDLCRPWQSLDRLLLPSNRKVHCCSESHCNRTGPRWDPLPSVMLPLALLLLLAGAWS
ncbi:urokinase plasminogen activator surface receptor [Alligator mississippiensis]|uniref:urokinase plasminogen activator surface receptor n=1 Tax=Alligator mississippiensis TaxID=8496 RepID=UPI0028778711|nr:urokinase plasminogen activator surface receptor [Alligator mississippiensis]XP_059570342.1 urokinase plasminogen activator surface receptor [Alligator mississippiensis]